MVISKCPYCSSENFQKLEKPHILIEQGYIRAGDQHGIEVIPMICNQCGFVSMIKKRIYPH